MSGWLETLGLTLVHFVWQGTLVAALLFVALAVLRRVGPETRYALCCAGLAAFVLFPVATFVRLSAHQPDSATGLDRALVGALAGGNPLTPLLPWIATFWLGGVSVLQVRTVYLWLGVRRLRRAGIAPLPDDWSAVVDDLCRRLGMRRTIRVVRSSVAVVPMVVGWLEPMVLVPIAALSGLDRDQLRAILAHELAHIRRHDTWVNLLQIFVETLLFYHPAVWWVSRRLRAEREYCCDDLAVGVCGNPLVYARALDRLDALRDPSPALAATGGTLVQRIERLVRPDRHDEKPSATGLLLAALALATGIVATGFTIAADEPPEPQPAPPPPPPVAAPVVVPVAAPVVVPVAAPVAVPVAAPVVVPVAAPVAVPVVEPVAAPVAVPVAALAEVSPDPPRPAPQPVVPTPDRAPHARPARPARPAPASDPTPVTPTLAGEPAGEPAPPRPSAEPTPVLAGIAAGEPTPALAAEEPAPAVAPRPPAEPTAADEIQRELDDIRRLRRDLELREERLLRMLDRYDRIAPSEPTGDDADPVVRIERKPVVRRRTPPPRRKQVVKIEVPVMADPQGAIFSIITLNAQSQG